MTITISAIRCSLQVALLGAVTYNLRGVSVEFDDKSIRIIFYYAEPFSQEEEDLSEIISTEVMNDFLEEVSVTSERKIVPLSERLPEEGIRVFHRAE